MIKHKSKITDIFYKLSKKYNYPFVVNGIDKGYFIDHKKIKHEFDYGTIYLNDSKYASIADNKEESSLLMSKYEILTPKEIVFKNINKDSAESLCEKINNFVKQVKFPIIIKPLNGRQGNNLFKIESEYEIQDICKKIIKIEDSIIVQEYLDLDEFRVVMLDGEILQMYKRFQPYIVGDGIRDIFTLIKDKNKYFLDKNRNTIISIYDNQIQIILSKLGYSNNSIPEKDLKIYLSFGKNLSKGGEYEFINANSFTNFSSVIKDIFKLTKLRLVGFDIFIKKDLEKINSKDDIVLIEYNASPDMENNFYYNDDYYENLVINYTKIFNAIINK